MSRVARTFTAILTYPQTGGHPLSITLPLLGTTPPTVLRRPTTYAGADAFEVFDLTDTSNWPRTALYRYRETIPRTITDIEPW